MIVIETFKQRKRVETKMTIFDKNEARHDKLHLYSIFTETALHIVTGGGCGDNIIPIGCQAAWKYIHYCREWATEHQMQDFSCQRNTLRSPAVFWRVNHS